MTTTYPHDGPAFAVEYPPISLNISKIARQVQKDYGKSVGQQMMEAIKLQAGRGRVSIGEYYAMRLFDDAALAGADKREFMGLNAIMNLCLKVNSPTNWVLHDKIAFPNMMAGLGFPVEPVLAVYGNAPRGRRLPNFADTGELEHFLLDPENYPLFGKPVEQSMGLGAEAFISVNPVTRIITSGSGRQLEAAHIVSTINESYADKGYVFQRFIAPHPAIRAICGDRLATLRIVTTLIGEARILGAVWKVPVGDNMVDNFARPGNCLASLDIETGQVVRALRGKGLDQEELENHPDTGKQLTGFMIPDWSDCVRTILDAAEMVTDCPLVGWDVAVTDRGPVIIEPNIGMDLRLLQHADRRGVYNDTMRAMLDWVAEKKRQSKKKGKDRWKRRVKGEFSLAVQRKAIGN